MLITASVIFVFFLFILISFFKQDDGILARHVSVLRQRHWFWCPPVGNVKPGIEDTIVAVVSPRFISSRGWLNFGESFGYGAETASQMTFGPVSVWCQITGVVPNLSLVCSAFSGSYRPPMMPVFSIMSYFLYMVIFRDQPNSRGKMRDFAVDFLKCAKFHGKFTEGVWEIHGKFTGPKAVILRCYVNAN